MKQFKVKHTITNKDSDLVERYFSEIANNKPLLLEEEKSLIKKFKNGDREAANKLIQANLKFVVSVAKTYYSGKTPFMDLVSEGNLGLFKALDKYDENRDLKFISYAVWWIRQSILQYINETEKIIRLPGNKSQDYLNVKKFIDNFFKKNGCIPTDQEICDGLDMSMSQYFDVLSITKRTRSISEPIGGGGDEDIYLEDTLESNFFINSDEQLNEKDIKKNIKILLSLLNKRDADIISAQFELLDDYGNRLKTTEQIQDEYNISETRINQLKHSVIVKLRCKFGIKKLQDLLY